MSWMIKTNVKKPFLIPWLLLMVLSFSCKRSTTDYTTYSVNDEKLRAYGSMYEVDREEHCLTPIDQNASVRIVEDDDERGYDVYLWFVSKTASRSVYFVQQDDGYNWMGEQEIHYSGNEYDDPDGVFREKITISYFHSALKTGFVGLSITYWGNEPSIPRDLNCEKAMSIIDQWKKSTTQ